MKKSQDKEKLKDSTLAALLKEKPKRGRPRHAVSRQNVYIALTKNQKKQMKDIVSEANDNFARADIPDLAVVILTARLNALQRAVADRNRPIPEGVTDLESLYLLWDLPLLKETDEEKWTSVRLSPQQALDLGRAHGTLKAAFGATRSQVFALALTLLAQYLEDYPLGKNYKNIEELSSEIAGNYL